MRNQLEGVEAGGDTHVSGGGEELGGQQVSAQSRPGSLRQQQQERWARARGLLAGTSDGHSSVKCQTIRGQRQANIIAKGWPPADKRAVIQRLGVVTLCTSSVVSTHTPLSSLPGPGLLGSRRHESLVELLKQTPDG